MMAQTVYYLLGLARKAGGIQSGDASVRSAIAGKKAFLVLLADDAAVRTKKIFEELAGNAAIPVYNFGLKNELGRSIGKPHRSVLAITDSNLARGIIRILERGEA